MFNDPFQSNTLNAKREMRFEPVQSNEPEVLLDINTTPLIDVLLVLIIMLIITIPAQLHSVNLEMPVATPPVKKVEPMVIKITIDASNTIAWNGKVVAQTQDLEELFDSVSHQVPAPEIHIRAQARSSYGTVMKVMAGAQRHGLKKIGVLGSEQFVN